MPYDAPHAEVTREIIGAFYSVYTDLGYGFLESVYHNAMMVELQRRGLTAVRETPLEVVYLGVVVGEFRADLICENKVLVEVKSGAQIPPTAFGQVLNYLRATKLQVGLLLHFGPKPAIKRISNGALLALGADRALSASRGNAAPG